MSSEQDSGERPLTNRVRSMLMVLRTACFYDGAGLSVCVLLVGHFTSVPAMGFPRVPQPAHASLDRQVGMYPSCGSSLRM
jgi:hypothetical protein